jgi:hypothetical protein
VGPFSLGNRTFDDNVVDLAIIISMMPFGVKICVSASGDCEDCDVGVEGFWLLRRLLHLWRR